MKLVKAKFVNGVLTPSEQIPTAVKVEFNGTDFVCYESVDEILSGGAEYVQVKPEPTPIKLPWLRNQISRAHGFFIRLRHKMQDYFNR